MRLRILCPTALPLGNALAARAVSIIVRRNSGRLSDSTNTQPATSGVCMASKYPGNTTCTSADWNLLKSFYGIFLAPSIGKEQPPIRARWSALTATTKDCHVVGLRAKDSDESLAFLAGAAAHVLSLAMFRTNAIPDITKLQWPVLKNRPESVLASNCGSLSHGETLRPL